MRQRTRGPTRLRPTAVRPAPPCPECRGRDTFLFTDRDTGESEVICETCVCYTIAPGEGVEG